MPSPTSDATPAAISIDTSRIPLWWIGSGSALLAVVLVFGGQATYGRFLRRIPTAEWVTPEMLQTRKVIRGKVTSVGDADNFRMYHTPGWGWGWARRVPTSKHDLHNETIHVRLAGVDAPELAHFGKPAQPYAAEALDWLTRYLIGRTVEVELASRDQYKRIVGIAKVRKFPWFGSLGVRNVSLEMLKAGFAQVYTGGGKEYGDAIERFKKAESWARLMKRGMWAQSKKSYISPAAYKKKYG